MGNRHRKSRPSAQHDGSAPEGIRRCNAAGMSKASKHDNPGKERFYGRLPRKVVSRCCSGIGFVNLSGMLIEVFSPLAMMGISEVQRWEDLRLGNEWVRTGSSR